MITPKRILAIIATAAVATTFLAVQPASAAGEATPPAVQDVTVFCAGAQSGNFDDTAQNTFEAEIDCIASTSPAITQGGPGSLAESSYGPSLTVTRGQMASFVARMIDVADVLDTGENITPLPEADGTANFTDVGTTSSAQNPHFDNIDRLSQAGIVEGGPGALPATMYGPNQGVTRAQMASFLNRAIGHMTGTPVASSEDYFTDDEAHTAHEDNINGVTSVGISQGTDAAGDTYQPGRRVTRAQMAGFIARTLAELNERGDIAPLIANEALVTLDDLIGTPGGDLTGDITGEGIDTVTVSGCGLADEAVTDTDPGADGIQFSLPVPLDQVLGVCTLTFTTTFADGSVQSDDATVTIVPAGSPTLEEATLVSDLTQLGEADFGDVYELVFDEAVQLPEPGSSPADAPLISFEDSDGDIFVLRCALPGEVPAPDDGITNAACTAAGANPAQGSLVTVTLGEAAEDTNTGTGDDNGGSYPLQVVAALNVVDLDGNPLVLGGDLDLLDGVGGSI